MVACQDNGSAALALLLEGIYELFLRTGCLHIPSVCWWEVCVQRSWSRSHTIVMGLLSTNRRRVRAYCERRIQVVVQMKRWGATYILVAFGCWLLYTVLRLVLHTLMLAVRTDTLSLLHVQTAFFTKPMCLLLLPVCI